MINNWLGRSWLVRWGFSSDFAAEKLSAEGVYYPPLYTLQVMFYRDQSNRLPTARASPNCLSVPIDVANQREHQTPSNTEQKDSKHITHFILLS